MHIDINFKQKYNKYRSTFIFNSYKTISIEERRTIACPNNDCQRHVTCHFGVTGKAPFDTVPCTVVLVFPLRIVFSRKL